MSREEAFRRYVEVLQQTELVGAPSAIGTRRNVRFHKMMEVLKRLWCGSFEELQYLSGWSFNADWRPRL